MRLALAQGRRVQGRTFPNPAVGAVLFRGNRILGRGATRPPGGPHAEIVALKRSASRFGVGASRGATLAVTLEPCCHTGRTPPCTEAILQAGVSRVLVGARDSHPAVAGRGVRRLRRAGVQVELGVLGEECRRHHRGFLSVHERGRPFLMLKLAASLDGRIATVRGDSRWITSAASRAWVHRIRSRVDAILVGSGTVLADDPELTARRNGRVVHRPVAVVADARLRISPSARLLGSRTGAGVALSAPSPGPIVLTGRGADPRRRRALEHRGARIALIRRRSGHLDLAVALERLGELGITTVLAEGGGALAAALIRAGLVDELHWIVAPKLLGGDGRSALDSLGIRRLADVLDLEDATVTRLGDDIHVTARGVS